MIDRLDYLGYRCGIWSLWRKRQGPLGYLALVALVAAAQLLWRVI